MYVTIIRGLYSITHDKQNESCIFGHNYLSHLMFQCLPVLGSYGIVHVWLIQSSVPGKL